MSCTRMGRKLETYVNLIRVKVGVGVNLMDKRGVGKQKGKEVQLIDLGARGVRINF